MIRSQPGQRTVASFFRRAAVSCLIFSLLASPLSASEVPSLFVPEGFLIERAAGTEVVFPMFAAFDDQGALYVAESSGEDLYAALSNQTRFCRVRKLEDRDGDGFYESSNVFVDRLVFPMGLAWRQGKLFVADPPDLVVFEDTNGDGRADRREVILTGFGHKDNGSLHGLIFGPDGMLYMTMGSPDGYKLRQDDGTYLTGTSGALIRCRPDGTGVEVLARGFENLIEVVFTGSGEIIGTDNWFQRPVGGIRDALVHLVEGGLYPYGPDTGTNYPITGDPLPAISLLPAVAVSGIEIYRGTAFPKAFQGNLFTAQFNSRKVVRHVLTRSGSTFRAEHLDFVTCAPEMDFHPSDVLEAADGSLLVIDTGAWYVQHCPTGRIRNSRDPGGIYRVRFKGAEPRSDPWGVEVNWVGLTMEQLGRLLVDDRPAVRDRAQQKLIGHGSRAIPVLEEILREDSGVTAKQHAIWSLAGILGAESSRALLEALDQLEPEIVFAAANALALRRDQAAAEKLAGLLENSSPQTQLAAALALARCGTSAALGPLWEALGRNPDPFLEHALVYALHQIADAAELLEGLNLPHPRQMKAALTLLDQPPRPRSALSAAAVLPLTASPDPALRAAAVHVLKQRETWAVEAVRLIQEWLDLPELENQEAGNLRALLLAHESHPRIQQLVGEAFTRAAKPVNLLLLEVIAESRLPHFPETWKPAVRLGLESAETDVRLAAARAAVRQMAIFERELIRIAEDQAAPLSLRLEGLRGMTLRDARLSADLFDLLLAPWRQAEEPLLKLAALEILRNVHLTDQQTLRALETTSGDSLAPISFMLPTFRESTGLENSTALLEFLLGKIDAGWRPSEREWVAFTARLPVPLRAQAEQSAAALNGETEVARAKLEGYEPLLKGGHADRGRAVFFSEKAACGACHAIGASGSSSGPDLTKIGAIRSARDLLESILFPSSTFAQGYEPYTVILSDGREISGVLVESSAERIRLRDSSGAELQFRRNEVETLERSNVSSMPEGLERALSPEEFRDLMAFLQSLR